MCQQTHYGHIFKISSHDQDDGGGESKINWISIIYRMDKQQSPIV